MEVKKTDDLDKIKQFYQIVTHEYYSYHGVELNSYELTNDYKKQQKSKYIYVLMNKNKVCGGFELTFPNIYNDYKIPCQKNVNNLSKYISNKTWVSNNYVEISKLAIDKQNSSYRIYSEKLIAYIGDLYFSSNFNDLVILSPKPYAILYKRSYNKKKYKNKLTFNIAKETYLIKGFLSDFYLSIIKRKDEVENQEFVI